VLAEHGITNFEKLRGQDPIRIDLVRSSRQVLLILTVEQLLNKKQASGHKILSAVREFPQYSATIHELAIAHSTETSDNVVDVEVDIQCSVSLEGASSSSKSQAQKSRHYHDMTYILTLTSDMDFIDFRRIPLSRSSRKMVIISLRNISQHQSPPRPEVVLCYSPTYEAEPKHMGLYVVCEPDPPLYIAFATTAAGRHCWRLHQLAVQA
jgi:hypothetical protein